MEFFHGEHLRLDWGLGNPNKTAALIACLLVVAHLLRYMTRKKWGLVVFGAVFLGLGICLIHTYSRGGILAALVGQLAYWTARTGGKFTIPPKNELICGIALIVILSIYSALPQINAASRYTQGVLPADEDRSITNRLRIWKDVPRMMVDAPNGWGLGKAGVSWMQWYQPTETRYQYRTLVNSHLTWLVEFSWIGRFAYLFGWGLIFALIFGRSFEQENLRDRRSAGIATGLWASFAVSMFFSSVAESWVLWILPIGALIWILVPIRILKPRRSGWRGLRIDLVAMGGTSLVILAITAIFGAAGKPEIPVYHDGENVILGERPPRNLLLKPDEQILGQHYGIHLRENLSSGWIIADEMPEKPLLEEIERLVLSGDFPDLPDNLVFEGEIVVFNSLRMLNKSGQAQSGRVILGSFRKDSIAKSIRSACADDEFGWNLELMRGKKIYLGNWMKKLAPLKNQ